MREVNAKEKIWVSQNEVNCDQCPAKGQIAAKIDLIERGAVDVEACLLQPAHQSVDGA
jgi:hypothetical protein